jgi:hypothetical protein
MELFISLPTKSREDPVIHNQMGFQSSAAVVNGTVYVGCSDGHVYAMDGNPEKIGTDVDPNRFVLIYPQICVRWIQTGSCRLGQGRSAP